ncbi:protein of unknown function [Legionella fallonii LLAP-10]|uniref:Uncharacterized protein n=1 Tax=Legionella fallonii LLAP-10 TaxID=1212491 RepID=A0A098G8Y8_9GAMM|nr:protein of unknown function [Legionella fallonii LLAP-10]
MIHKVLNGISQSNKIAPLHFLIHTLSKNYLLLLPDIRLLLKPAVSMKQFTETTESQKRSSVVYDIHLSEISRDFPQYSDFQISALARRFCRVIGCPMALP